MKKKYLFILPALLLISCSGNNSSASSVNTSGNNSSNESATSSIDISKHTDSSSENNVDTKPLENLINNLNANNNNFKISSFNSEDTTIFVLNPSYCALYLNQTYEGETEISTNGLVKLNDNNFYEFTADSLESNSNYEIDASSKVEAYDLSLSSISLDMLTYDSATGLFGFDVNNEITKMLATYIGWGDYIDSLDYFGFKIDGNNAYLTLSITVSTVNLVEYYNFSDFGATSIDYLDKYIASGEIPVLVSNKGIEYFQNIETNKLSYTATINGTQKSYLIDDNDNVSTTPSSTETVENEHNYINVDKALLENFAYIEQKESSYDFYAYDETNKTYALNNSENVETIWYKDYGALYDLSSVNLYKAIKSTDNENVFDLNSTYINELFYLISCYNFQIDSSYDEIDYFTMNMQDEKKVRFDLSFSGYSLDDDYNFVLVKYEFNVVISNINATEITSPILK